MLQCYRQSYIKSILYQKNFSNLICFFVLDSSLIYKIIRQREKGKFRLVNELKSIKSLYYERQCDYKNPFASWTQVVNWASYVRSIDVLCPGGEKNKKQISRKSDKTFWEFWGQFAQISSNLAKISIIDFW